MEVMEVIKHNGISFCVEYVDSFCSAHWFRVYHGNGVTELISVEDSESIKLAEHKVINQIKYKIDNL